MSAERSQVALVIDSLTPEEIRNLDALRAKIPFEGILVGAIPNLRDGGMHPLVLSNRQLYLLRTVAMEGNEITKAIDRLMTQANILGLHACGVKDQVFWYARPFYQNLLSDLELNFEDWDEARTSWALAGLFRQFTAGLRTKLQHGNIWSGNIAKQDDELSLLDYGASWQEQPVEVTSIGFIAELQSLSQILLKHIPANKLGNFNKLLQRFQTVSGTPEELADFVEREVDRVIGLIENNSNNEPIKTGRLLINKSKAKNSRIPTAEETVVRARVSSSLSPAVVESIRKAVAQQEVDSEAPPAPEPIVETAKNFQKSKFDERKNASLKVEKEVGTVVEETKGSFLSMLLVFCLITILSIFVYNKYKSDYNTSGTEYFSEDLLQNYWNSGIPSRIKQVAEQAVYQDDQSAELIILKSVLKGDDIPGIRTDFLRVAFNPTWEHELNLEDRKLALSIGLSDLLGKQVSGLKSVDTAHPGIILAVVASLPLEGDIGPTALIPVSVLGTLPKEYSHSFAELSALGTKTFAEPLARAMAKLLCGVVNHDVLQVFMSDNNDEISGIAKLRALIRVVATKNISPDELDNAIKNSPGQIKAYWDWFEQDTLGIWSKADVMLKLNAIADVLPKLKPELAQRADLLTFPATIVAYNSVNELSEVPELENYAQFLRALISAKNQMNREQIVGLVIALASNSANTRDSLVAAWFRSNPVPAVIAKLLADTATLQEGDSFSLEAARYLKNKEWQLQDTDVAKLVTHPEILVRALVFSKLSAKEKEQRKILEIALRAEKNIKLKEQLLLKLTESK